jgi:hypothetical protein
MTREEYEERKRALEAQHSADVALMNVAHQARMRTLEDLWQCTAARAVSPQPMAAPALPSAPSAPPAPDPKPKRARFSVLDDLTEALPGLPETFDKHDIVRAIGYEPSRATLFRALLALGKEGRITNVNYSIGGATTRYRKLAPPRLKARPCVSPAKIFPPPGNGRNPWRVL